MKRQGPTAGHMRQLEANHPQCDERLQWATKEASDGERVQTGLWAENHDQAETISPRTNSINNFLLNSWSFIHGTTEECRDNIYCCSMSRDLWNISHGPSTVQVQSLDSAKNGSSVRKFSCYTNFSENTLGTDLQRGPKVWEHIEIIIMIII